MKFRKKTKTAGINSLRKKMIAMLLAAVLLSGGFGTFPAGSQTVQAAVTGGIVTYDTDVFQDIPYIVDTAGVSIYINDPIAFALENAELTTSVSGVSLEKNYVTTESDNASYALVWSDWSNRSVVSGTNYSAWKVTTGVSSTNPITLSWEDAAQTEYGEPLDVKLVITGLNLAYVGRRPNAKTSNGYWGLASVSTNSFKPRTNMTLLKTGSAGDLLFQTYACSDASDTGVLDTVGNLTFGASIDYHLEFYDTDGNRIDGIYLMYMQDVDVKDIFAYRSALAGNGWSSSGVADEDDKSWWDPDSAYIESVTFPSAVSAIYAIDRTSTLDTSLIQYSSSTVRRISSIWSSQNQIAYAENQGYTMNAETKYEISSVQAAIPAYSNLSSSNLSKSTMTWTGSKCSTSLFEAYEPDTGTISLTKKSSNSQNLNVSDLAGALYAVHQQSSSGPIVGFFVTDSDGTGYTALVSTTKVGGSVAYTANGTTLYYYISKTNGSSTKMEVSEGQYYIEELISPYGYALDTSTHKITVTGGANQNVESTDAVDYQIVMLKKKSLDADGSTDTDDSVSYGYTVVISGLDAGQQIRYTVNGGSKNTAYASNDGTVTLSSDDIVLQNGQSAFFEIPNGSHYQITESANAKIASYTVTDAKKLGKIVSASGANAGSQESLSTGIETADSGEDVLVTFTNTTKSSVPVLLTKVSVDADGNTDQYDTDLYTYNISLGNLRCGDIYSYTDRTGKTYSQTITKTGTSSAEFTLSLLADETVSMLLPAGATYSITETANAKIPSYTITDANGLGQIVSASGQKTRYGLACITATETANAGEKVTVTFVNKTDSSAASGSLIFDANGGEYSDGTDVKTLLYKGVLAGYEGDSYSGYSADAVRNTNYTKNEEGSDSYAVPVREGYTFLGWASASDADTAYYTDDYTKDANLANIENQFPELINASTGSYVDYCLLVPGGGLSDTYTWYYEGNYFRGKGNGTSVYDDLMQQLGVSSDSSLTALLKCSSTDDYYCSVSNTRNALWYYTSYEGGEYIFPSGTYYCAYETDGGEVSTAHITLAQSGTKNYFSIFTQTLYAVWERDTGYLSLTKAAHNTQNMDDPDLAGALYAVHQTDADGEILGYFVTDADGTGYAASTDSGDADTTLNLSADYDGTTYYATDAAALVLETGTYYVEELASPDMYACKDIGTVTVAKDNTEKNPAVAAYADGGGEEVTYLKVNLKKYSYTADGSEDESDTVSYTYTVRIRNLESGDKVFYTTRSGGSKEYTRTAGSSGTVTMTLTLKPGEEIYFLIPFGATYAITEASNKKIASYTVVDKNGCGKVESAFGSNEDPYTALSTETETADEGEDVTVAFTNTSVGRVDVLLKKQSVDSTGNEDTEDTTAYSVYVYFAGAISGEPITYRSDTDTDNSGSIKITSRTGSATVVIQSGETITFSNVPVGAVYYFREEINDRIASYEVVNTGSSGTVEGEASHANETSGLSLTTATQTAESGEETLVTFTNRLATADVQLYKTNGDGTPLAGAVFDLYDDEDTLLAEDLVTGEDGYTAVVENLSAGEYYFVETDAPEGYAVTSENPIAFTISEEDYGTTVTVTVTDRTLQVLPNAGGGLWMLLIGSVGAVCAALCLLRSRRIGIVPVP